MSAKSASTRVALIILAALIIEAIIYFQHHQIKLLKVHLGEPLAGVADDG